MKRLWLILLSLGLIVAFSTSAMAVEVQFSGEFYAAGMYQDKTTFNKEPLADQPSNLSTAFYYQRLRVNTEFIVAKGLKLVTRFDAMERAWGAARSTAGAGVRSASWPVPGEKDPFSAGTAAENENIAFDHAYVEYISPIGMFVAGWHPDGAWGTVFSNTSSPNGLILYGIQVEGLTAFLQISHITDKSKTAINPSVGSDLDSTNYQIGTYYEWKTGQAGLLGVFYRSAGNRTDGGPFGGLLAKVYVLQPYAIVNIGPVKIQAELDYAWGDIKNDNPDAFEARIDNLAGWIDATADFKQFYVGGSFAYVAGMNWDKMDLQTFKGGVVRGGFLTGGMDYNPTLILFNSERQYWAGPIDGYGGRTFGTSTQNNFLGKAFGTEDTGMYNALFFQVRAGVRPLEKLDVMLSVSYALADSKTLPGLGVKAADAISNEYGWEIDLTGTYKITNNLSYMMGAGYLFTGDYFKGSDPNAQINNNFILLNKLTLTF